MASTVHVLRHGEVENPEKILYGRQPGWRLSERGQEMAKAVAQWSTSLPIAAIHASPLQRAQETAAPLAQLHNLSITTDPVKMQLLSLTNCQFGFYALQLRDVDYFMIRASANAHLPQSLAFI